MVDIYLFRADSKEQILHKRNYLNPFLDAGYYPAQINDTWFGTEGNNWNGQNTSFPYYWVITRSDKGLDGTEQSQPIFSAIREYFSLLHFHTLHLSFTPDTPFFSRITLSVLDFTFLSPSLLTRNLSRRNHFLRRSCLFSLSSLCLRFLCFCPVISLCGSGIHVISCCKLECCYCISELGLSAI